MNPYPSITERRLFRVSKSGRSTVADSVAVIKGCVLLGAYVRSTTYAAIDVVARQVTWRGVYKCVSAVGDRREYFSYVADGITVRLWTLPAAATTRILRERCSTIVTHSDIVVRRYGTGDRASLKDSIGTIIRFSVS